jgi:hypothetical protein
VKWCLPTLAIALVAGSMIVVFEDDLVRLRRKEATAPIASASPTDWPKWVANGIATINLLFVCWMAWYTTRCRSDERREDVSRAVGIFWVQDLVLKPNIEQLHEFFEKYEAEMDSLSTAGTTRVVNRTRATTKIREFKKSFHSIKRKVVVPLCLVSNTFNCINDVIAEIEDLVTEEYARIPIPRAEGAADGPNPVERFRDLRAKFFRLLHVNQLELVKPERWSDRCKPGEQNR